MSSEACELIPHLFLIYHSFALTTFTVVGKNSNSIDELLNDIVAKAKQNEASKTFSATGEGEEDDDDEDEVEGEEADEEEDDEDDDDDDN